MRSCRPATAGPLRSKASYLSQSHAALSSPLSARPMPVPSRRVTGATFCITRPAKFVAIQWYMDGMRSHSRHAHLLADLVPVLFPSAMTLAQCQVGSQAQARALARRRHDGTSSCAPPRPGGRRHARGARQPVRGGRATGERPLSAAVLCSPRTARSSYARHATSPSAARVPAARPEQGWPSRVGRGAPRRGAATRNSATRAEMSDSAPPAWHAPPGRNKPAARNRLVSGLILVAGSSLLRIFVWVCPWADQLRSHEDAEIT